METGDESATPSVIMYSLFLNNIIYTTLWFVKKFLVHPNSWSIQILGPYKDVDRFRNVPQIILLENLTNTQSSGSFSLQVDKEL